MDPYMVNVEHEWVFAELFLLYRREIVSTIPRRRRLIAMWFVWLLRLYI